ncbi:hypothetical protein Tco_1368601 [Tanacetum coccineum]
MEYISEIAKLKKLEDILSMLKFGFESKGPASLYPVVSSMDQEYLFFLGSDLHLGDGGECERGWRIEKEMGCGITD